MTTIDFYTRCANPFEVASRLVTKAWARHGSVRVLTSSEDGTVEFGRFLWLWPATGFLPHCRLASPLATETPIVVDHVLDHEGPAAVLINLNSTPPPFFSRFERVAEIVGAADVDIAAGRERWKFYKARGYEIRSHDLSAKAPASVEGRRKALRRASASIVDFPRSHRQASLGSLLPGSRR